GGCAAEEPQVPGHERQHARREEGQQAREQRDRHGDPERAEADEGVDVHGVSASVSLMSVVRIDPPGSWPMMLAATRPCRSRTSVVGVAWIGTRSAKASLASPVLTS